MFSNIPLGIQVGLMISLVLIVPVTLRKIKNPNDVGIASKLHSGAVILISTVLFFGLSPMILESGMRYLSDPHYEAEVIEVRSEVRASDAGGSGDRGRGYETWYSKVYRFTDNKGVEHVEKSALSSTGKPEIGKIETVTYADNVLQELTIAGVLMTLGGFILLHMISLLPIYYLFQVAWGGERKVINYGIQFVIRVIMPMALGLFLWAMLYKLYLGYIGAEELPLGGVIVMVIFIIILTPVFISMLMGKLKAPKLK